jgi:hypothetical protein
MQATMKRILLLLLIPVLATSCKQEFLERTPVVGATEANFYKTPEDALSATIACYNTLQQEVTNIQGSSGLKPHFRWYFGDVCSDDTDKGGSGDGDDPQLYDYERFQGNSAGQMLLVEWQVAYRGIAYCNLALQKIPEIDMDADVRDAYLGEARFIRAYWYFTMVTTFGGVPLVTTPLASSEYQQPRASADEIWALIKDDLAFAIEFLPQRSEYSLNELGRATRGAAQGLMAKTNAYLGEWEACYQVSADLVSEGEYSFDEYGNIFTELGENGPGSIWEIQYMNASGGNWGQQLEGTFTNVFQRARGQFNGYGFNLPTQDLVDAFEVGDPRLQLTLFQVGDVMGDRGTFTLDATGMPHLYYPRKNFNNAAEEAPFGDPNPNGHTNDRVIRLADVMLFHAEACINTGRVEEANVAVNAIRDRARGETWCAGTPEGAAPCASLPLYGGPHFPPAGGQPVINPDVTLEDIWHERRVELALEGHRFFDLARQGRAASVMQAHLSDHFPNAGYTFTEGVNELFPIPSNEITLSGGLITQNPGY